MSTIRFDECSGETAHRFMGNTDPLWSLDYETIHLSQSWGMRERDQFFFSFSLSEIDVLQHLNILKPKVE